MSGSSLGAMGGMSVRDGFGAEAAYFKAHPIYGQGGSLYQARAEWRAGGTEL